MPWLGSAPSFGGGGGRITDGVGVGTDGVGWPGVGLPDVGLPDGLCDGPLADGEVGTGVGSGGTGIVEVGDGVAESDGDDDVEPEGEVLAEGLALGLTEVDGAMDEFGVGGTSARAGSARARQHAAVSAAITPRRTTRTDTPLFLPINTYANRTAG